LKWTWIKNRFPPVTQAQVQQLSQNLQPLSPWLLWQWTFRDFVHRVLASQLGVQSAALTYSLILAFVPLLALGFTILKAFGGLGLFVEDTLDPLIRSHFGTVAGAEIATYLDTFVNTLETRTLGAVAVATLFFTVVQLLVAAENAINGNGSSGQMRSWTTRLVSYWTLITLMPVVILISATKSRAMMDMLGFNGPLFGSFASGGARFVRLIFGIGLQCLSFGCLYKALIARSVPLRYLLAGGAFASFLFEALQHINGFLIKEIVFSRINKKVYGTVPLVAVIVFLWMRLVWVIILLGAALVASLSRVSHFIKRIYTARDELITKF